MEAVERILVGARPGREPAACASGRRGATRRPCSRTSGTSASTAGSGERQADHGGRLDDRPFRLAQRGRAARRAAHGSSAGSRGRPGRPSPASRPLPGAVDRSSMSIESSCSTNSGLPSAAATIRPRSGLGQPGLAEQVLDHARLRRHPRAALRTIAPAVACPPQSGCVSSSSFRPRRAHEQERRPRIASARWSSRSRKVGSAQWMSSMTDDQRPIGGERSRGSSGRPRTARRPGTDRSTGRSPRPRRSATSRRADAGSSEHGPWPPRGESSSAIPAACADDLDQRPERDAVAVGQAAAPQRPWRSARPPPGTRWISRDLPTPASPTTVTIRHHAPSPRPRRTSQQSGAAPPPGRRSGRPGAGGCTLGRRANVGQPVGRHRLGLALERRAARRLDLDRVADEAVGQVAEQDLDRPPPPARAAPRR